MIVGIMSFRIEADLVIVYLVISVNLKQYFHVIGQNNDLMWYKKQLYCIKGSFICQGKIDLLLFFKLFKTTLHSI